MRLRGKVGDLETLGSDDKGAAWKFLQQLCGSLLKSKGVVFPCVEAMFCMCFTVNNTAPVSAVVTQPRAPPIIICVIFPAMLWGHHRNLHQGGGRLLSAGFSVESE